jgi:hypothetical protein
VFDVQSLIEKLRRVEALHGGATTPGEREAAANAMRVLQARLHEMAKQAPPIEYQFSMVDTWSRRLFVALARRYGLAPYRYRRQRRNTVMLKVSKPFVDETLWPEFQELDGTLRKWLAEATDRAIAQVFGEEAQEAEERPEQRALPAK